MQCYVCMTLLQATEQKTLQLAQTLLWKQKVSFHEQTLLWKQMVSLHEQICRVIRDVCWELVRVRQLEMQVWQALPGTQVKKELEEWLIWLVLLAK